MSADALTRARELMRAAGVHPRAVEVFSHHYRELERGEQGFLAEQDLEPVDRLPRAVDLEVDQDAEADALRRTAVVKLNGGLGTSMGMDRAKSLVEVRPGSSFLDLIADQVLALRERYGVALPLLLMNSFRTRDDSVAALARHQR
ncbi:MAG TPA: UTP--glucose-1-phosphate uridylyltransferase, partial [Actinotalea sp.]|nr:UTP--glucose-1-phosphate uridylyltransferase [Actinotalea sp.]